MVNGGYPGASSSDRPWVRADTIRFEPEANGKWRVRVRLDLELVMIVHGQLDVKHQPTYNHNLMIFSIYQNSARMA